jgi:hypothetical protein
VAHIFDEAFLTRNTDYAGANAATASAAAYAAMFAVEPDTTDLASRLQVAEAENRRLRQMVADIGVVLRRAHEVMDR